MESQSPICALKGIGAKTEQLFHKIGVYTIGDILLHYPRDYEKLPPIRTVGELLGEDLRDGMTAAVSGRLERVPLVRNSGRTSVTSLQLREQSQSISLVWFHMPYLKNSLKQGEFYVFLGKISKKGSRISIDQPQVLAPEAYLERQNSLWPCYALT